MIAAALKALHGQPQLTLGPFSLWVHERLPATEMNDGNILLVTACWDTQDTQLWTYDETGLHLEELAVWLAEMRSLRDGDAGSASIAIDSVRLGIHRSELDAFRIHVEFSLSDDWVNWCSAEGGAVIAEVALEGFTGQCTALAAAQPIEHGWVPPWGGTLQYTNHVAGQLGWPYPPEASDAP